MKCLGTTSEVGETFLIYPRQTTAPQISFTPFSPNNFVASLRVEPLVATSSKIIIFLGIIAVYSGLIINASAIFSWRKSNIFELRDA